MAGWPDVEKVKDSGAYATPRGTLLPPWADYISDAASYTWLAAPDVIGDETATGGIFKFIGPLLLNRGNFTTRKL